jgi:small-conductance mechanosensitive channel
MEKGMNDEKEVEKIARKLRGMFPIATITEQGQYDKAEKAIIEALLSHGKSCYEKGVQEAKKKVCGPKYSYVCQVEAQQEEITRLKERLSEQEKRAFEYHTEWESACLRERGRIEDVKDLERRVAEETLKRELAEKNAEGVATVWKSRLTEAEKKLADYENRIIPAWKQEECEWNDRLANSWEKRTVEELTKFMHLNVHGTTDNEDKELATALIKFMEDRGLTMTGPIFVNQAPPRRN